MNHELLFKRSIIGVTVALLTASPLLIKPLAKLKGIGLNGRAWRATFSERHLPVPSTGPREGYWGARLKNYGHDPDIGVIAPETHIPGLVEVDRNGLQYAFSAPHPDTSLLIIGGSVAFGAYASRASQAYFHHLALRLGGLHHRVKIIVQATGGWTSVNELAVFKKRGIAMKPDYVLLLDGMNDVVLLRDRPEEQRVREYLERMREIRDLALAHGIKVIFCPQPFLPEKNKKSALEVIILNETYHPLNRLIAAWAQLREGLDSLAIPGKVYVLDASGVFDHARHTIFTDIFHFTDIGQFRLGRYMAKRLDPILANDRRSPVIPKPNLA
jgi:hypothetical protein